MTYTRTFTAPAKGPQILDIAAMAAHVVVSVVDADQSISVVLSTDDADDSPAAQVIDRVAPEQDDYAFTVRIDDHHLTTQFGGAQGVVQANVIHGNVIVGGVFYSDVQMNSFGRNDSSAVHLTSNRIIAQVKLPKGSGIRAKTVSGAHEIFAAVDHVVFKSTSGSLRMSDAKTLNAETVSGAVHAAKVGSAVIDTVSGGVSIQSTPQVIVRTTSGRVRITNLVGDGTGDALAEVYSASGAVDVTVTAGPAQVLTKNISGATHVNVHGGPATVRSSSVSGAITVTDPDELRHRFTDGNGRAMLSVSVSTVSGRVRNLR